MSLRDELLKSLLCGWKYEWSIAERLDNLLALPEMVQMREDAEKWRTLSKDSPSTVEWIVAYRCEAKEWKEKAAKWDRAKEILPPLHLCALAKWIDLKYPNDNSPEIQTDLRRLADLMEGKEEE